MDTDTKEVYYMAERKLGAVESRFADLIWENEPIPSGELVKVCQRELCWKKPTTYNVLRKLCERGIFQNVEGVVTSVISRSDFYAKQGEELVDEAFGGSLPAFIAAFSRRRSLSDKEIDEIRRMIDTYTKK